MKDMKDRKKNSVYGVIGLVALFLVGGIFGFVINGSDRLNTSIMTKKQCDDLAERIISAARNNQPDLIAQLNKVFSENCNGRDFNKPVEASQPKPQVKPEEKLPENTCEAIEKLLKEKLNPENSDYWEAHDSNAVVYKNLVERGCEQNRDMYQKMSEREDRIAQALGRDQELYHNEAYDNAEKQTTCEQIESLLKNKLYMYSLDDSEGRVQRAQIYANLSERGCAVNSAKYKELAKKELDIARALNDDNIEKNREETTEMVETYKRLQMQQEAAKMIEKAKKLTNPAIDFIIQLEKIIEE